MPITKAAVKIAPTGANAADRARRAAMAGRALRGEIVRRANAVDRARKAGVEASRLDSDAILIAAPKDANAAKRLRRCRR